MIQNIYEPDNKDVLKWINNESFKWPASDWDYYVMNGKNDELVFNLANDRNCTKRNFFIQCLYYLVGEYFNNKASDPQKKLRIDHLLNMVDVSSSEEVIKWKQRTLSLLTGNLDFNANFWLDHIFNE